MEEFAMSFIKTIFSMLFSMTIPIAFFAVIAFGIYKLLKNIKIEDFNRGERKILQKDERINIIYQIRKDDPDFSANEVEQMILNFAKKQYPNEIFREGDFNIVEYNKIGDKAQITYSILASSSVDKTTEYRAVIQMKIRGSDDMSKITNECHNCGAVIEDANNNVCPYCGQTYEFNKYNNWKVMEIARV